MPIATVFTRQFLIALTLVGFPSSIAITLAKVACTMTVQREKGKGEGRKERRKGKDRTGQEREKRIVSRRKKQRHTINLDPIHMKTQHLANVP
jgi:type III secretory pathway component EscV